MRNNRQSIIKSLALVASLLVIAGAALILSRASVAGKAIQTPCTEANLAGDYGFMATGAITGAHHNVPKGNFVATGVISFDGQGKYTVSDQNISYNGFPVTNVVDAGRYTVTPDCVCTTFAGAGTPAGGLGLTHSVFVNDRREAFMMKKDPDTAIGYTLKRME